MKQVSVAEARRSLAAVLDEVATEPVVIERRGRATAVIVDAGEYERLRTVQEDLDDITAFDSAMAEEGHNLPWDQAKADLGWS
ncbi:MAG: type II toxin-antitoxin system Phd/YefM family antitoxin [Micrococcales bacterium]|nr:type II toxin-antitoxin system Phd/YefM family antitoxin [Micrococcales bacterium]